MEEQTSIFKTGENDSPTKAVLVSAVFQNDDRHGAEVSLSELEQLLKTAGGEALAKMVQYKTQPDPRTYIGSGKVKELRELCINNGATLVVFDTELSPSQIRNIENELNGDEKDGKDGKDEDGKDNETEKKDENDDEESIVVIDRSMLILDIFALHAKTGEGKLQVELALLKYSVPRLAGKGLKLSRLGGGIGTRGPGETKLETDRRHLKRRMDALEAELAVLEKNRTVQRKQRDKSGLYKIAIAGYTNAGKSTLLNYLTDAGILAENKLFATLDPTTRKYTLPDGNEILLTDTVGFIRNLPHHLIRAFKSTLEEVCFSDAVLIVIDATEPECDAQLSVTENLLEELGATGKPILYVYNKCDLEAKEMPKIRFSKGEDNLFFISAKTGEGTERLIDRITSLVNDGKREEIFIFPHSEQGKTDILYKNAVVLDVQYTEEFVIVRAICDGKISGMLKKYSERKKDQ